MIAWFLITNSIKRILISSKGVQATSKICQKLLSVQVGYAPFYHPRKPMNPPGDVWQIYQSGNQ